LKNYFKIYKGHVLTKDGDVRKHFDEFISWKKQTPIDVKGFAETVFKYLNNNNNKNNDNNNDDNDDDDKPFFAMINLFDAHRNVDGSFVSQDDEYYELPQQLDKIDCLLQMKNQNSTLNQFMMFMGDDYFNSGGSLLAIDVVR